MKRLLAGLLSATLALCPFSGAVSASPASDSVKVTLNGQNLPFPAPPRLIEGKTFVEFRALFQALGYSVDYVAATRTVKARSSDRHIEMKLGGGTAMVNGSKVPADGGLKVLGGRTLVGVRFIAVLSGMTVEWNGNTRTVVIKNGSPSAAERESVTAVLDRLSKAEAAGDVTAYMSEFLPDAHAREAVEAAIREQFGRVRLSTRYLEKKLVAVEGGSALVATREEIRKTGGAGFFPENRSEFEYHLRKNASGQWKIDFIEQLSAEVLDPDGLWKQEIEPPAGEKQALLDLARRQEEAVNARNYDGLRALYRPGTEGLDQEISDLKDMQDSAETAITLERMAVVEHASDRAVLLLSLLLEIKDGSDTLKGRTVVVMPAVKVDAAWLFEGVGEDLHMERL